MGQLMENAISGGKIVSSYRDSVKSHNPAAALPEAHSLVGTLR
jgi:hypothetical protein